MGNVAEGIRRRAFRCGAAVVAMSLFVAIAFAQPLRHPPDERQLLSFGRDVTITESHGGDIQLLGARLEIDSSVSGDVVVLAGDLVLGPQARIRGDVIVLGGRYAADERAAIEGELYLPGQLPSLGRLTTEKSSLLGSMQHPFSLLAIALKISLLFAWFAAALMLALTSGREIRMCSAEVRASPYHTFALGLVAFTSFLITAVVFSYLVPYFVGLFLLAVLVVFAMVTKIFGMVAVFHAVGTKLVGPKSPAHLGRRRYLRGDLAMTMIGLFVLGALRLIPFAGTVIWIAASIFGIGTVLATKFGRRDPWFLRLQPESIRDGR